MSKVPILEVPIDNLSFQESLARTNQLLKDGQQHYIVTVNPEFLVAAAEDAEFRQILQFADIALADGTGLLFAARLYGKRLQRVTGIDFMWSLCEMASEKELKVFLLGAAEGVAQQAADELQKTIPNLQIVGTDDGGEIDDPKAFHNVTTTIRDAQPDILLVAFGHVRQEKWIYYHLDQLPSVKVAVGVGGSFDYIAGMVPRAPEALRRLGLEWLYRLIQEPWRWRRMVDALIVFPYLVLKEFIFSLWPKK